MSHKKNFITDTTITAANQFNPRESIDLLIDNRWIIIITTAFFIIISSTYALLATPIFSADALIQIEKTAGGNVLSKISEMLPDGKSESKTEIGLLKSRMVLGKTIKELSLDIVVQEKQFPIIGKGISRLTSNTENKISVSHLSVPTDLFNAPLILTVNSQKKYSLKVNGKTLKGTAGETLAQDKLVLLISDIASPVGTEFIITKLDNLTAINRVLDRLSVSEQNRDSGILQLSYRDEDPTQAENILNSIANNYLQQNVKRKSEEAANSLAFLDTQLPLLRDKLTRAESRLNHFRQKNESVDLNLEAKSLLENLVALETQINELTFNETEISKLYTREHPSYRALREKKSILLQQRKELNAKVESMPKTQQEILSLTRDVQSGHEIYMFLLNKQQELSINKASAVGNVRIIDTALAEKAPIYPRKLLLVFFGIFLGLFSSVTYIIICKFLRNGIESSSQIENMGLNVYASIPVSPWLKDKNNSLGRKKSTARSIHLLAKENPTDLSVEAIRSLRTSLHFAMLQARNNILLISGATPEAGKTFVSCNLSAVIAQSNKKVLLIDADLRKGQMHHVIGCHADYGLSEALSGEKSFEDILQPTETDNLTVISRGKNPPNPSELLMTENFSNLMNWATTKYDLVIIDSPPVLAVSDACIIAKYAGTTLLVARYKTNTFKELEASVKRFEQNNLIVNGAIFNGVERTTSNNYEYGNYSYN